MGDWVEFTARTVSDALTDASVFFQVPSTMIDCDVIEEQKNGLLGLFSRPAKIKARILEKQPEQEKPAKAAVVKTAPVKETKVKETPVKKEFKKQEFKKSEPVKKPVEAEEKKEVPVKKPAAEKREPIDQVKVEAVARKFLVEVLGAMKIKANVVVSFDLEEEVVAININGEEDMGILIGKRGQTLDSLQYLTSLVINKETTCYLKVKLDTENYRERRKETLENLAKNIAYKVKRTKHSVSLEPMNPYERRIIHSTLQADKYVDTHSEGEEPYRRVVVTLKKGYRDYGTKNNNSRYNGNRRDYKNKKNFSERGTAEVKTEE